MLIVAFLSPFRTDLGYCKGCVQCFDDGLKHCLDEQTDLTKQFLRITQIKRDTNDQRLANHIILSTLLPSHFVNL